MMAYEWGLRFRTQARYLGVSFVSAISQGVEIGDSEGERRFLSEDELVEGGRPRGTPKWARVAIGWVTRSVSCGR